MFTTAAADEIKTLYYTWGGGIGRGMEKILIEIACLQKSIDTEEAQMLFTKLKEMEGTPSEGYLYHILEKIALESSNPDIARAAVSILEDRVKNIMWWSEEKVSEYTLTADILLAFETCIKRPAIFTSETVVALRNIYEISKVSGRNDLIRRISDTLDTIVREKQKGFFRRILFPPLVSFSRIPVRFLPDDVIIIREALALRREIDSFLEAILGNLDQLK